MERRSRRPRPGSGSCRARSTSRSRPRSTRWTGSKRRAGPLPDAAPPRPQGDLLPRRRQLGELPARRRQLTPTASSATSTQATPTSAGSTSAQIGALAPILRKRFDLCARKGFDAVEPDNIAGYENKTGFPLSGADQLRFNRWVAREVHRRGMSVALKNDPDQVRALVGELRLRRGRGVLRIRRVREVQPLRRRRQGGLHGRVRRLAGRLLPAGGEARASRRSARATTSSPGPGSPAGRPRGLSG